MTALVFLWALVRALVVGVTPVPLPVFILPIIFPLLLRTPPVFVTLVLLWALRLVPAIISSKNQESTNSVDRLCGIVNNNQDISCARARN